MRKTKTNNDDDDEIGRWNKNLTVSPRRRSNGTEQLMVVSEIGSEMVVPNETSYYSKYYSQIKNVTLKKIYIFVNHTFVLYGNVSKALYIHQRLTSRK